MNISSLVVSTLPENTNSVVEILKSGKLCEYHAHKEGKIVVTIEGDSVSDEIRILNEINGLDMVVAAEMIYSYCEDELEQEREHLEVNDKLPEWLNDENAKAEDIKYNGRLPI